MKTTLKIGIFLILSFVICGCGTSYFNYDKNRDYGFNAGPDSVLQNPPANKVRIYSFREDRFQGSLIRYNITAHSQEQANAGFKDGFFFGYSYPGAAFMLDIIPSQEEIVLSGKTEARVSLSFTPSAGKIYCIASGVGAGFLIGRPLFAPVEKEVCEKYISKYLNEKSKQKWEEYRQNYLSKGQ